MQVKIGGPMFEPVETDLFEAQRCLNCGNRKEGAHYNIYHIKGGMQALKNNFPEGEADELNFVLFSTSGVHSTYTTIEDIEQSLQKYGVIPTDLDNDNTPDDYYNNHLTVLIIQPRICCLKYGNVDVTLDDIPYLKKLRQTSWDIVKAIES